MIKEQVAKELQEQFQKGNLKPSQLKKSKSTGDLKKVKSEPLSRSQSSPSLELAVNSQEFIEQLETKISVLELKLETSQRELSELNSLRENNSFLTQENSHLKEQIKNKHKELEGLREQLSQVNQALNSLKSEQSSLLDANLTLKHQSLKDWFKQYEQTQKVEQELKENIEYASNELTKQDKQINSLQSQITKLKQTNQSLEKDLELTQKLAELRKRPYFESEFNFGLTSFKYAVYVLLTVWFCFLIRRRYV